MGERLILVDTSVWVEYLRDTDDAVVEQLAELIGSSVELAVTEPIVMELLAGATSPRLERAITSLVDGLTLLPIDARLDYRAAAQLFVASRRNGHPVRSLVDCLISAAAVRRSIPLLHRDRDFDYLAEVCPLQVV